MTEVGGGNCGTGAGGFARGNTCQRGGHGGGASVKSRLRDAADAIGEQSVKGDAGHVRRGANREALGVAAGEYAATLPDVPPITDADVKAVKRAKVLDLTDYPEGPARDGMRALAEKAGTIPHELGGGDVLLVAGRGDAGKVLRSLNERTGPGGLWYDNIGGEGADILFERATSPAIESEENDWQYRRVTAGVWLKGSEYRQVSVIGEDKVPADVKAKAMGHGKATAALSAGVPLILHDADRKLAPAVEIPAVLEGRPATLYGRPVRYFKKEIARVRDWTHRGTGEAVLITRDRVDNWTRNTRARLNAGIWPYVPNRHRFGLFGGKVIDAAAEEKAIEEEKSYGRIYDVYRDGDGWYAKLMLVGDAAADAAAANDVSIGIVDGMLDADGNVYGEALEHVAVVGNPALPHLKPFEPIDPRTDALPVGDGLLRIAASAGGTVDAKVYELAAAGVPAKASPILAVLRPSPLMLALAGGNCGANAKGGHGFQPGNKCQKGGSSGGSPSDRYVGKGDTVKLPGGGTALVTHVNGKGDVYGVPKDKPGETPKVLGKAGELPIESKRAKGNAAPPTPAPAAVKSADEPKAGNGPIASAPLPEFASRVQAIADNVDRGFGDNKVFIADAFKAAKDADPSLTEAVFKTRLREANRARLITLSRADLVSAMDPKDVAASYVNLSPSQGALDRDPTYGGKTESQTSAHFILVKPKAGRRNVAKGSPNTALSSSPILLALAG